MQLNQGSTLILRPTKSSNRIRVLLVATNQKRTCMVTRLSAADMAYLFSILIGIVVSGILFFNERFKAYCVRWLALSYLFVCLTFFVIFFISNSSYRTGTSFLPDGGHLHANIYALILPLCTDRPAGMKGSISFFIK